MNADFSRNHFELFALPVSFDIDVAALERAYRDLQREVHPDRFAAASDAEKRLAAQWATRANEGYLTLKSPLKRGRYFLHINGIETEEESNTAMPIEFLEQQMEWREAVVDAKAARDEPKLDELAAQRIAEEKSLFEKLAQQLSMSAALPDARLTVRKLRFLEKLGEEIDEAFEVITA
ncbi:MAG: Fe-S protein assembly co-chaperone HscB [Betaproteobacteria bacterium]